jgi:hypothetical protein
MGTWKTETRPLDIKIGVLDKVRLVPDQVATRVRCSTYLGTFRLGLFHEIWAPRRGLILLGFFAYIRLTSDDFPP